MDQTTKVALITSVTSILVALITTTLPLYNKNKKLKKEIRFITTGMVVAYFFSFIEPLFEDLKNPQVMIKGDEGDAQKLMIVNKKMELILPRSLDSESFYEAKNYVKDTFKEGVLINGSKEFKIKYRLETGTNNAMIIIDTPNILKSAVDYFKESRRTSDFIISDEFKIVTEKELSNFKSEINRMIANSEFAGKVNIVQI